MVTINPPDFSSRLILDNNHHQLALLGKWVQDFANRCRLSEQSSFNLALVLTEAVTNVMDHAGQLEGKIEVSCRLQHGCILAEIIDEGAPFDSTVYKPALIPEKLEDATPGGLGIHLMRSYANDMQYRRENDCNILRLSLPI